MKIKNLSFTYSPGERPVFAGLQRDFIEPGISALMGPSGCGKTTLLKLMGGLLPLSSGYIDSVRESGSISWVFQEARLVPWLSLRENVLLPLGKFQSSSLILDFERLAELFDMGGVLDLYPHELSGGMKSRGAIMRSLLYPGALFLWDEPFAALDKALRDRVIPEIRSRWKQQGVCALIALHDAHDAHTVADEVVMLP